MATDVSVSKQQIERMTFLLENLLVLDALSNGIKINDVRTLVKIDKKRVNHISKLMTAAKKRKG